MARQECTENNIADGEPYKWCHPDAKCIKSNDSWHEDESCDEYKCPYCGVIFKEYISK